MTNAVLSVRRYRSCHVMTVTSQSRRCSDDHLKPDSHSSALAAAARGLINLSLSDQVHGPQYNINGFSDFMEIESVSERTTSSKKKEKVTISGRYRN